MIFPRLNGLLAAIASVWGWSSYHGIEPPTVLWQEIVVEFTWSPHGLYMERIERDGVLLPDFAP